LTFQKGGSVADTFLADSNYKVRGLTRDPSKPSAQEWVSKGAEVVAAELDDVESLKKAFKGASVIFGVTDFWQHVQIPAVHERAAKEGRSANEVAYDREVEQGKNIVDAAAANIDTLDRFVLSIVNSTKQWSKGKIDFNLHFDSKWAVAEYLKEKHPDLDKKTSYVHVGCYASNWKSGMFCPTKQEDGSYKLQLPLVPDAKVPFVDTRSDTGMYRIH
jgi:hypothetical protein